MSTDKFAIRESKAKSILTTVGTVLIIVGLADIAYMIYFFANGGAHYSSSLNIFALIGGLFLRAGNLRAAQLAGYFVRFAFVGVVLSIVLLPFLYPLALIETYFVIVPNLTILLWLTLAVGALGLLWWLDQNLQSQTVTTTLRDAGLHEKWPRTVPRLRTFFLFAAAIGFVLVLVFVIVAQSDAAALAISKAQEKYGENYKYHVSSLSISSGSGGREVKATVIAYSDSTIETLKLRWVE